MISLSAVTILLALAAQDAPRQVRVLGNGASVVVESMPNAKSVSIVLAAKVDGAADTAETHGRRHLLEHLLLARPGLDAKMEAAGVFFTGRTFRHHMEFEAVCPPDKWQTALTALKEVIGPLKTTEDAIKKEAKLMGEELMLRPNSVRLMDDGFHAGYGESGLDSAGEPDLMAKLTPEDLERTRAAHFDAANIRLSIAGSLDAFATLESASGWLLEMESAKPEAKVRGAFKSAHIDSEAYGELRGAPIGSFGTPESLATLGMGLAIASRSAGCFLINTPSDKPGMVAVGRTDSPSGLGLDIDGIASPGELIASAKNLLPQYFKLANRTPSTLATWNAQLLVAGPNLTTTILENRLPLISTDDWRKAFESFKRENCVVVSGG